MPLSGRLLLPLLLLQWQHSWWLYRSLRHLPIRDHCLALLHLRPWQRRRQLQLLLPAVWRLLLRHLVMRRTQLLPRLLPLPHTVLHPCLQLRRLMFLWLLRLLGWVGSLSELWHPNRLRACCCRALGAHRSLLQLLRLLALQGAAAHPRCTVNAGGWRRWWQQQGTSGGSSASAAEEQREWRRALEIMRRQSLQKVIYGKSGALERSPESCGGGRPRAAP